MTKQIQTVGAIQAQMLKEVGLTVEQWQNAMVSVEDFCELMGISNRKLAQAQQEAVERHTYQDIVNHFVKIIGNGTMVVETINESILVKMLESKGIKIPIEKSFRDIDKDYKIWLENEALKGQDDQTN